LINAKPKARRRILEEAAGISGLYQRRHEAELKLNGAETNLARVDDVIEQLANQLAQLARQARAAARYREIGNDLRRAEGMLLYRRWREADDARAASEDALRLCITAAAAAQSVVTQAAKARQTAEDALPALREEEAIASAVLQRLTVQRDTLAVTRATPSRGWNGKRASWPRQARAMATRWNRRRPPHPRPHRSCKPARPIWASRRRM